MANESYAKDGQQHGPVNGQQLKELAALDNFSLPTSFGVKDQQIERKPEPLSHLSQLLL